MVTRFGGSIKPTHQTKSPNISGCVEFKKDESHFTVHLNANSIPYLMHAKNKLNTIQELKQIVYSKDQPLGKKRPN